MQISEHVRADLALALCTLASSGITQASLCLLCGGRVHADPPAHVVDDT